MKVKAKPEYSALPNTANFLALGSASTHLWLLDGREVDIPAGLLPLAKKIKECLTEVGDKKSAKNKEVK